MDPTDTPIRQRDVFRAALMFFTRLPVSAAYRYHPGHLEKATRWLPLVGWILALLSGGAGALVWLAVLGIAWIAGQESGLWAASNPGGALDLSGGGLASAQDSHLMPFGFLPFLDPGLGWFAAACAGFATLAAGLLLAGAFHEDGFADLWDGFGGGMGNRERTLEIMKDSRLGTFGGAALILLLAARIGLYAFLLSTLTNLHGLWAGLLAWLAVLVFCQGLARTVPMLVIMWSTYAREDATAKSKPLAKALSLADALPGFILALVPLPFLALWVFRGWTIPVLLVLAMPLLARGCTAWFKRVLGGYTGDCLGAAEQLAELACLVLSAAALSGMALLGPGLAGLMGV